jgi:hypothetical protein
MYVCSEDTEDSKTEVVIEQKEPVADDAPVMVTDDAEGEVQTHCFHFYARVNGGAHHSASAVVVRPTRFHCFPTLDLTHLLCSLCNQCSLI